ncbi:MAG: efflux RND transporter permease subunit [Gammaproteobacteria bacterium]|nr:efflux RND transporter permease subunit [Gammaproteobacteria bacterium]MDH5801664.1 efflux RND transporter permease subunit [Gammaproteobacteria bacterium]
MNDNTRLLQYSRWVVSHPWKVMLITLLTVLMAASGLRLFSLTTSYRVFFSHDNPQLVAFEQLEKNFTKNDNIMFMVIPKDGKVFTESTLKIIRELTTDAWQIPFSIRVDSVTNFQNTRADGDDLYVGDLVGEEADLSPAGLAHIEKIALSEPVLLNRIVSDRAHVAGVNVTIQLPGKNPATEVPQAVAFARDLAAKFESKYADVSIRLSGITMMNNAFSESSKQDMQSLVPISFAVMLIALGFLIKGVSGALATMVLIVFSIVSAMGLGFYLGFPISPPSSATPTIILTVAIANAVHVLVTYLHELRLEKSKPDAMVESLRINFQPVFLASLTTSIGFLTMNFSDVPPFQHLGTMVAIGVLVSFILAVFFLPAVMMLLPTRVRPQKQTTGDRLMGRLGNTVVSHRRKFMWGMLGLIAVLVAFVPKNELNDVFVHYFDESVTFRQDADFMAENLSGLYIIDYSLESGKKDGISDPVYLNEVEQFAEWFRRQPETIHVSTFSDVMKRINKNMNGDDPTYYRQPERKDLAAQFLLLYEMSLPYRLDLNNQINVDKSATRFTATLKTISSNQLIELEQRAQNWLEANTQILKGSKGSGTSLMFAHIGEVNIKSMLTGTTLALVLISIILIFALRSVKIGIVSMVPNLVPAAMGFGLWGILVGEVGLSLSVVASMTLGIVVDDTVHFLSKYLRARREKNLNSQEAVRYAFTTVGLALTITSIVLVMGFLVLSLSSFQLNSGMGLLTSVVIAFALMADFLFLPPLLMKLEEKTNEQADTGADTMVRSTASA